MAGNDSPTVPHDAPPPAGNAIDHPDARRNHWTGVAAGGLGGIAKAFLDPDLIVAGFIYALTKSTFLVAMVAIVSKGGVLAFQLVTGSFFEHHKRKMPVFALAACVRAACYAGMAVAMWGISAGGTTALVLFFAVMLLAQICGGTGHVLFMDMVGRMIPTGRLGSFFGARNVLANILAILAGLLAVQPILRGLETPWNYMLLICIGGVVATLDMALFTRCREYDEPAVRRPTTFGESFRRGLGWLRTDHNYRMFFWWRIAFRFNVLVIMFFIPYGAEVVVARDGAAFAMLGGVLVATVTVSRVTFSMLWGALLDRRGYRPCLIGGGVCFVLAPCLALAAPLTPRVTLLPAWLLGVPLDGPLATYLAALLVFGAAMQSTMMGGTHFIVSSAPPGRRPSYAGFANTVTSPLTLLPFAAAALAPRVGLRGVFVMALLGGVGSLVAATRMRRPTMAPSAAEAAPAETATP